MAATTETPAAINARDFLRIDALLDDEERMIRDTVRAYVREQLLPQVPDVVRARDPAARDRQGTRRARAARHAPRGLRLRGHERGRLRPRVPRARGRRQRPALARVRPGLAVDVRDLALRLGGAEAGVAAADGGRRRDRLLRAHRARRGLRPRLDAHARPPRRRRLDPQRARRCGSRTARSPTSRSSGRGPTTASAASSCPRARRASRPRTSTRSCRCARRSRPS